MLVVQCRHKCVNLEESFLLIVCAIFGDSEHIFEFSFVGLSGRTEKESSGLSWMCVNNKLQSIWKENE
jgi:hypothetical protein